MVTPGACRRVGRPKPVGNSVVDSTSDLIHELALVFTADDTSAAKLYIFCQRTWNLIFQIVASNQ